MTDIRDIFHCLRFLQTYILEGNKQVKYVLSHPKKPEIFENVHMLEVFILLDIYHSFFFIAGGHICSCVQKTNRA